MNATPPWLVNPDTEDCARVRATSAGLLADPQPYVDGFYRRVFERAPGLRSLFKGDMQAQKVKLAQMITSLVSGLDRVDLLVPSLRQLGASHRRYGAKHFHYVVICDALLDSVADANGALFDESARLAWQRVLALVTREMLTGARDAERAEAASRPTA